MRNCNNYLAPYLDGGSSDDHNLVEKTKPHSGLHNGKCQPDANVRALGHGFN